MVESRIFSAEPQLETNNMAADVTASSNLFGPVTSDLSCNLSFKYGVYLMRHERLICCRYETTGLPVPS